MTVSAALQTDEIRRPARRSYPAHRQRRQVSDDILVAFHFACDIKDLLVAQRLLQAFESLLAGRADSPDFNKGRAVATLVAAHERLWNLRVAECDVVVPVDDQDLTALPLKLAVVPAVPHRWPAARRDT
jgi:hypothetical protein